MIANRVTYSLQLALIGLLSLPVVVAAQGSNIDARLPMSIDADSTSYDGKTSTITFNGLRLMQGHIGIQADKAHARNMELEDSTWQFDGNVVIDVEYGHIECDSASLLFDDFRLKLAEVTGSPATFTLSRPNSDEVTYAEAGNLSYHVDKGIIEFSEQAIITEGGNKFSSEFLVYNIVEQRIKADSSGAANSRVRITYTPATSGVAPDATTDKAVEDEIENP